VIDLTGDFLLTYLVREIKDVVNKHPRFKNAGGDTIVQSSNGVQMGDCRITVSSVSTQGNRLSPDYFMYTKWGYSVLGKLPGKQGLFVEWVEENRGAPLEPAVYYIYVESVDERTRDAQLVVKKFVWANGALPGTAQGSFIYLREGIAAQLVTCPDPLVKFDAGTNYLLLLTVPITPLVLNHEGSTLVPGTDYWVIRTGEVPLAHTSGGLQRIDIDASYVDYTIYDAKNGYTLKADLDYSRLSEDQISLSAYTPPGSDLRIIYNSKADPSDPVHPENRLDLNGQTPVWETVWIKTSAGVFDRSALVQHNGGWYLKDLLRPGFKFKWDMKVDSGDTTVMASKMATNTNIIPGLTIAIGDKVEATDEVALIVSKDYTQTYEVFGSTENISFTIKVTANDRDTVSDLSGMLKEHLLVRSRDRHESSGLTIYEASMNTVTEPRDSSGVHMTSTREISVTAAADWRYFVPLVTQVGDIDISQVVAHSEYPGRMAPTAFGEAFGLKAWQGSTITKTVDPASIPDDYITA
jgi:hypothetical protein